MPFSPYVDIARQIIRQTDIFTPDESAVNLIITLPSGSWVSPVDCTDGNPRQPEAAQLQAYAKRDLELEKTVDPGLLQGETYALKGRLILPVTLPVSFRPNTPYVASFEGISGYFYSLRTPDNPFGFQEEAGSRIAGLWSSQNFGRA